MSQNFRCCKKFYIWIDLNIEEEIFLPRIEKSCNFVKNWYIEEISEGLLSKMSKCQQKEK